MTTEQMIEALSKSNNQLVSKKCQDILDGKISIQLALRSSGAFMCCVLKGDYKGALERADMENKIALFIYKDDNNL